MKTILMMATMALMSFSASAAVNPDAEIESEVATTTVIMTFAELKAVYGAETFQIEGDGTIADDALIQFTTYVGGPPCDGLIQCGALLAQQRHISQQLANECCCVQYGGGICCDNGNVVNVLFIVNPTHCN